MTFGESIKSVFTQYANFSGRASRSEYWWFMLFNAIVTYGLAFIGMAMFKGDDGFATNPLSALWALGVFLPSLAVAVRRLHDIGKGGEWYFIVLIPVIGWIWFVVLTCQPSEGDNRFGPDPNEFEY